MIKFIAVILTFLFPTGAFAQASVEDSIVSAINAIHSAVDDSFKDYKGVIKENSSNYQSFYSSRSIPLTYENEIIKDKPEYYYQTLYFARIDTNLTYEQSWKIMRFWKKLINRCWLGELNERSTDFDDAPKFFYYQIRNKNLGWFISASSTEEVPKHYSIVLQFYKLNEENSAEFN